MVLPAKGASGIAGPFEDVAVGSWFGGALLSARACPGSCMCETFRVDRTHVPFTGERVIDGMRACFCKTAFRPYDLAVTACLIVFQHHLGDHRFAIRSDGESEQWEDARMLVQDAVGFGARFRLPKDHPPRS